MNDKGALAAALRASSGFSWVIDTKGKHWGADGVQGCTAELNFVEPGGPSIHSKCIDISALFFVPEVVRLHALNMCILMLYYDLILIEIEPNACRDVNCLTRHTFLLILICRGRGADIPQVQPGPPNHIRGPSRRLHNSKPHWVHILSP
jgi:hypothetical protein